MEAETEADAIKEHAYWLVCHDLLRLHVYTTQDHLSRDGNTTSRELGIIKPINQLIHQSINESVSQSINQAQNT